MTLTSDLQFNHLIDDLIQSQYLTMQSAADYYRDAQNANSSFVDYLVVKNIVPSIIMASKISVAFGLPLFDLDSLLFESLLSDFLEDSLIQKYRIFPVKVRGNTLFIAISDPFDFQGFEEIRFSSRLNPELILVESDKLNHLIHTRIENKSG